jgi:hypothetical protein
VNGGNTRNEFQADAQGWDVEQLSAGDADRAASRFRAVWDEDAGFIGDGRSSASSLPPPTGPVGHAVTVAEQVPMLRTSRGFWAIVGTAILLVLIATWAAFSTRAATEDRARHLRERDAAPRPTSTVEARATSGE